MGKNLKKIRLLSIWFTMISISFYVLAHQYIINKFILLCSSTGCGLVGLVLFGSISLLIKKAFCQEKDNLVLSFNKNLKKIEKNIYQDINSNDTYLIIKEGNTIKYCLVNLSLSYFDEDGTRLHEFNHFPHYEFNSSSLETKAISVRSYCNNQSVMGDSNIISSIISNKESIS